MGDEVNNNKNMKIVKCRSCQADIFFIPLENGKRHPVNVWKKRIFVFLDDLGWQLETGYESHFSTCPQANAWRKKKYERKKSNDTVPDNSNNGMPQE
uniref:Uncharacterized protein n=1 Tax=viral metagenome TaxID=1070528 RepID=A0A6M3JGT2_9ZZZZ